MYAANADDGRVLLRVEIFQIGQVLEIVCVNFAAVDDLVRLHVVFVFDNIQRDRAVGENIFDDF